MLVVVNRYCVSVGVGVGVGKVVSVVGVVGGIGIGIGVREEERCVRTAVVAGSSVPIVVVVFGVTSSGGSAGKFPRSPVRERHIDLADNCHKEITTASQLL